VVKLKILYISNVFPRVEDNSTIYTDLAEELKKRGHDIFVVAGDGTIDKTIFHEERGIPVLRVKTGTMYDVGFIKKGLTILTLKYFFIYSIKLYLKNNKFDFILFESPPVTIVDVIKWAMNFYKCTSYLMLKDIFPQNAVDIGLMKKGGLIHRYFRYKEKKLYNTAGIIGCMSKANMEYLLSNNPKICKNKIEIFPNTKKIKYNELRTSDYKMRNKYSIPLNVVVAVFGGNMGKPQGIDFLIDVIKECKNMRDIFFLLVGHGTERSKIRRFLEDENPENILLLDPLPRDEYESLITECDIGLIFLDKRFTIPNFPSRVLSYFEYEIPVIAATDKNTDFGQMIEIAGGGYWVETGNKKEFLNKLSDLVFNPEKRKIMGKSGRKYLEKHFNVETSADILEKHFNKGGEVIE
jgi:glycosyltransferase involved in cell wall biosynthesis